MLEHLAGEADAKTLPIHAPAGADYAAWLAARPGPEAAWLAATGFEPETGALALLPGPDGLAGALFIAEAGDPWGWAQLPARLPPGRYRIEGHLDAEAAYWAALAWELAAYRFTRYSRPAGHDWPVLVWPDAADRALVSRTVRAIGLVRDLVNTPSSDMGPEELAIAAADLAHRHAAQARIVTGEMLLRENYPLIHAVGRGSIRAPRLVDLRWGDPMAPKVTLVGKGVCFDSGGLDIKPAGGMKTMKKDMGGAAHVLGLAGMIMDANLPVRLRVLVPAVENAVSGAAFRPLDVIRSRAGITVEIGNTDAEGRLVLADCLTEAASERPDLILDLATLTGAARTALGPDLPALFSPDDALAQSILEAGQDMRDPLWRLPLWQPYRRMLDSKVADINNASDSAFAGAITAALFLKEFVPPAIPWAHLDIFAWNQTARPGRPEGGEAMGLRALYAMVAKKFPS